MNARFGAIVRREVGAYARTPMGWLVAALVLSLDALQLNGVAMGSERRPSSWVLEIFLLNASFLTEALAVLLTMRLQLDEREAPLWRSLPLGDVELVLGRFTAAMLWLGGITLATLYLPALIFVNGHVSLAHIATGYASILLVGALGLAIGSWMAALTRRPLTAALATAGVLAMLELGYYVATTTSPPWRGLLRDLAPVWGRGQNLRRGIFSLADVAYYLVCTTLVLSFAVRAFASRRRS